MSENKHWMWGALVGAAAGALIALALGRPEAPAPREALPTEARPEVLPSSVVPRTPDPPAPVALKPPALTTAAPKATLKARPLLAASDVANAELRCARGAPEPCLDVGHYYAEQGGQETKSLTFRRRALVLYAEACQRREAPACRQLSQLYEHGIGVSRDANTAAALLQRYLELCASGARCGDDPEPL
ncbi:MAG: hypothetical protein KIT72_09840 [Polyangiaceae bacterium]|nr:hypothetical protein [Polyangiaceae bacterium]MCW5790710.1 hypothetical protein [Polyangiaceae bacterium]